MVVLQLQLGQAFGFLSLHADILLLRTVVGRLVDLNGAEAVGDSLTLSIQLLSEFELSDDHRGCVADPLNGEDPGPVWPDKDSHSPWNDFRRP